MSHVSKERILVTGISGAMGQLIARELAPNFDVIGVDKRPFPNKPPDVELMHLDLRRKSAFAALKKKVPKAIVHIGVIRNPSKHREGSDAYHFNLETTSQLLKLAEDLGVRKFIFLSSANLYGPSARSAGFLQEDAALHGADRSPEIRDLIALDMMIQSFFWKMPQIETVILRPVHIIGAELNNAPSQYYRLKAVPTLLGYDPMIQLVHASDVARVFTLALQSSTRGIFNIIGDGAAPLSRMISALDKINIPMPEIALRTFLKFGFRYRFSPYPPGELDHLKYTCMVDGRRAERELGYLPEYNLMESLMTLKLQDRPS
ncbi:MAG: NAD-dependent epimerase/dehydratase family protein [Myxococcota bacterium]